MTTDERTFLLGVGCQKGGTSWLHDYLARSPACARGIAKEATVFDSLDVPEHTWQRRRILEGSTAGVAALERGEPTASTTMALSLLQAAMLADTQVYYDYYTGLVNPALGRSFTLDLTPNYALLPPRRFREIKDEFARRGVRTKVVFLLRDPVDRVWSQVRMQIRQRGRNLPDRPHERSEAELVLDRYRKPTVEARTRYEHTFASLAEVFDDTEVHVELYERLFRPESLERICAFVGIEAHAPDFDRKVNASPRETPVLPDAVAAEVARHYADTYRAVEQRLGAGLIDDWPNLRFVR